MSGEACLDCGGALRTELRGLEDTRFGAQGAYDIAACEHCSLEQTVPRPSAEALAALYEAHYNFGGSNPHARYSRLGGGHLHIAVIEERRAVQHDLKDYHRQWRHPQEHD